jgi:hypothetical protein
LNNGQPHEERRLKAYFLVLYYSIRGSGRERRPESALPGFSINEILNESRRPMFPDTVFAEDEITKTVESLLKESIVNILTPFAEGDDEIRYDLQEPIKSCLETFLSLWHRFTVDIIISHWEFFRKSLPEERIWLKHFFWKKSGGQKRT